MLLTDLVNGGNGMSEIAEAAGIIAAYLKYTKKNIH